VTQPLRRAQWHVLGIDIASGQRARLLTEGHAYCLSLGSQYLAWYRSRLSQDRLSFITGLGSASPCPDYRVDAVAVTYLRVWGKPVAHGSLYPPGRRAPAG
jgi:hypothetical protein